MDKILVDQLDTALHDIFRAMNLDRLPVHREGGNFSSKNLSLMETRILRYIDERGTASLKDLRTVIGIPNSSLTSIIKKFEQKKLIDRIIDPNDRRSFLLVITQYGHLVNEGHRLFDQKIAQLFIERIGSEEAIHQFINIANRATREPLFSMEELCTYHINYMENAPK